MKKFNSIIILTLICAILACCFGCMPNNEGYIVTLYVVDGGVTLTYSESIVWKDWEYLVDFMDYLVGENGVEFEYSIKGGMVESVNGVRYAWYEGDGSYWTIYTNAVKNNIPYFDESFGKVEVEEKTLFSGLKGVEELPIVGGASYCLTKSENE